MTIIERMAEAMKPHLPRAENLGPIAAHAALRAVRPEDVTDKMLNAYAKALEDNADIVFTERARRAIAAAIAAGGE